MKRFWLEEESLWCGTMTSGTPSATHPAASRSLSGCTSLIAKAITLVLFVQLLTICAAVGQNCTIEELGQCLENEMCTKKDGAFVCVCKTGFVETGDKKCERPSPTPEPSPSHVGVGLGVTFVILLVGVLVLVVLHRRTGLLSPLLSCLPSIRPFGSSGGRTQLQVVEVDDDDDVNPIA